MGQNLILNMNDHGFKVVAHNRTAAKVDEFLEGPAKGTNIVGAYSLEELVEKLETPRKIMLMVRAGDVVDAFIDKLAPLLDKGDIIIDGGNTNFPDTNRRVAALKEKGIYFIGTGVSGGEEGARFGPSIMPGGSPEAWPFVKPIFQVFMDWNETELNSYLVEITADILGYKDTDGEPLVEKILDTAGQKGTGKWTGINALDMGIPLTLITESVFSRCLSALKDQRIEAEQLFSKTITPIEGDKTAWIDALRQALLASKIISYAQGFMLMREASNENGWDLNYGNVALMWRGGCIIRSAFLGNIRDAYDIDPELSFLGSDSYFKGILEDSLSAWRKVASKSMEVGIPMPCMTSALTFLDGYTTARLPANLLQAQRDYFGAHTYERLDKPRGEFFHTNWTGKGGDVSSTTYNS
ncbi:UNVERIFIED_CONTAM: hypothetical protein GTU68_054942 [Idotea baltica]|nr:hypothetical protein [Idotea baltica]